MAPAVVPPVNLREALHGDGGARNSVDISELDSDQRLNFSTFLYFILSFPFCLLVLAAVSLALPHQVVAGLAPAGLLVRSVREGT